MSLGFLSERTSYSRYPRGSLVRTIIRGQSKSRQLKHPRWPQYSMIIRNLVRSVEWIRLPTPSGHPHEEKNPKAYLGPNKGFVYLDVLLQVCIRGRLGRRCAVGSTCRHWGESQAPECLRVCHVTVYRTLLTHSNLAGTHIV